MDSPVFRAGRKRRFTCPEMSAVSDSVFACPGTAPPRARPAGGAAGALRPRPVRVKPGRRAARPLAPRPAGRAGLPGAVPAAHPGAGRVPVAGRRLQTVQQALRDFARAMAAFFDPANPAGRPSWRKAGRDEGFRITGRRGRQWDVRRLSRKTGQVWVPKAGWVRFRWSRAVPPGAKSYRVTMDRAGRWHVAFAVIPAPVPAPGNGQTVGIDRGVAVAAALSTGQLLHAPALTGPERTRLRRLQRRLARATRGSHRRGRVEPRPPGCGPARGTGARTGPRRFLRTSRGGST